MRKLWRPTPGQKWRCRLSKQIRPFCSQFTTHLKLQVCAFLSTQQISQMEGKVGLGRRHHERGSRP